MKLKNRLFTILGLLFSIVVSGQDTYKYKRDLKGIKDTWHAVVLPDAIFQRMSSNLSDIRIKGVTKQKDTIEAPYLLKIQKDKNAIKEIEFTTLNTSFNAEGYFYTFKINNNEPINSLELNFGLENFNWKVTLEGSDNGKDWYTLLKDYRIVSIKNESTDFTFTKLSFPSTNYSFLRLLVKSKTDPELTSTSIYRNEFTEGVYKDFEVKSINIQQNEVKNTTEIEVELPLKVPVSHLNVEVKDSFDYYRPITIQYVTDSIKTEHGWYSNYKQLTSGTLHSIKGNEFTFESTTLEKLKIIVYNNDNEPLNYGNIKVEGYEHILLARFTTPADYFLAYGNKRVSKPHYDIEQFVHKIPRDLSFLSVGEEQLIGSLSEKKRSALFENKAWLWVVMALIIFVLSWFTFKMMRKA